MNTQLQLIAIYGNRSREFNYIKIAIIIVSIKKLCTLDLKILRDNGSISCDPLSFSKTYYTGISPCKTGSKICSRE